MILELRKICKNYYSGSLEVPVLKDIDFSIEEGEYVAIMGPSGSGKSTLMNLIGCLETPTSGTMILDGSDVAGLGDREMADLRLTKLGFIFQSFQLLPNETALENVILPLSYANVPMRERRERGEAVLRRVGLEDRMRFKPTELSGGQKQRVAIARAMINNPKLLLADEPTGALDSTSGRQVMELFEELNAEGVTVLMITHDPNVARRARRIVEIRDGELISGEDNVSVLKDSIAGTEQKGEEKDE